MKAALPLLIFLLAPHAWSASETDDSARAFVLDWVAAYNRNDPALMAGFYAEDPRVTVMVSVGQTFRGYQAIAELYRSDMQVVEFYDSYAKELQVWTEGDTALVSFEHFFKYYVRPDKSRWNIHIRTTMTLRRDGDGWKIIQEHSSPIQGIPRATRIQSSTGS
ncbi:YybH family protein [Cerasicoccus maritimus]|uniref:YybH family protein n=1 Tax=Cerasicoccus maritimus TaxID=490089 RepID=UPI00285272B7|nr:nuclear transport factor 2 family protein [Cerasicoccus maritimus]